MSQHQLSLLNPCHTVRFSQDVVVLDLYSEEQACASREVSLVGYDGADDMLVGVSDSCSVHLFACPEVREECPLIV